eukprot:Nitzschia sp. Nitz4//scaffold108_size72880//41596//43254//NITZ4_005818-RA/size72880-processed-gene-0.55-mRNA-1//-1//CDS//3329532678//761//frame0
MSLKQKMAAFQQAAHEDKSASVKQKIVVPKGAVHHADVFKPTNNPTHAAASKPKVGKLNANLVNVIATGNSKANPSPSKIKPMKIKVTANAHSAEEQEQENMSDKAKTAVVTPKSDGNQDWDYLYELALQYDQYKLQEAEEAKNPRTPVVDEPPPKPSPSKKGIKAALEGIMGDNFTANGKFLTKEYIDKYLVEDKKFKSLTFDYCGQSKLFKRFDRKDDEQRKISKLFVDTLLKHPRASEITAINMANALIPDEFLLHLAKSCLDSKGLPKLQVLNMESNLLGQEGIAALSQAIANPQVWRRLQILKLENQKTPLTSDAEEALGQALLVSPSLVVVSLRVRGGLERQQINNSVAANIDNLRQARRKHQQQTGTLKERKRNEMEQYFDKIALNDASITEVNIVGNIKYLGLNQTERCKSGAAFATNSHVRTLQLVKLKLDDAFCVEMGKAIAVNTTLEKVILDSNAISGAGMKSLFEGLGKNQSIVEFQARHQEKKISSADEQALPPLLQENKKLIKLGVDLRDQMAKMQLERKTNENREYQRKLRVAARGK